MHFLELPITMVSGITGVLGGGAISSVAANAVGDISNSLRSVSPESLQNVLASVPAYPVAEPGMQTSPSSAPYMPPGNDKGIT
jgi:hypothetical protein